MISLQLIKINGNNNNNKCDWAPPTILLQLLLCPWKWDIIFWLVPTFSCQRLFSSYLRFLCSHKRRWVHVLLLYHFVLLNLPESLGGNKQNLVHTRTQGKEQSPLHKKLSQTFLWVFKSLLQRCKSVVSCHKDRGPGNSSPTGWHLA